jgi:FKBP-type peptidyl-prolyl cis-trans isomerase FkpA
MKMIRFLLCVSVLLLLIQGCSNDHSHSGYSDGPSGISYKLLTIGDNDKKAELGSFVFLKAVFKTEHDSVFWDWKYNADKNYFFEVTDKKLSSPFFGFLLNRYAAGDSLKFRVDKTVFFREVFDTIVPWFATKDSSIIAEIMIDKIFSPVEFARYNESMEMRMEAAMWQQKDNIENWVSANMKKGAMADSLLYYEKLNVTTDSLVKRGSAVTLFYTGAFMDGKVFDEVKPGKPVTINYGYEGQLLPGIEKVLPHLRKGESAKIIIPSHLGFGNQGSSDGSIPPCTPVIYEVKILDIK